MTCPSSTPWRVAAFTAVGIALTAANVSAQYTPIWYDGYNVSGGSSDINFEVGTRQGGPLVPINYVANTGNPANDYHHQVFGAAPLQLAGDAGLTTVLVSPNYDFSGTVGSEVVGTKLSLSLDANTIGAGTYFTQAGITLGSSSTLAPATTKADGFSVLFIEDTFGGNGNFIQLWDGSTLVDNLLANPAGGGWGNVELFMSDAGDGNPWDGVGSTTIDLYVNSIFVSTFTKGAGGYTANFLTLEGSANFFGTQLATHVFDDVTVYTSAVPEPSTFALAGLGLASLIIFRRRK